MPEDFLGLFRNETDVVTLRPGQELFKKGDFRQATCTWSSRASCKSSTAIMFSKPFRRAALSARWPWSANSRAARPFAPPVRASSFPWTRKAFCGWSNERPFFAVRVMRVMSERLKTMNVRVTSLSE